MEGHITKKFGPERGTSRRNLVPGGAYGGATFKGNLAPRGTHGGEHMKSKFGPDRSTWGGTERGNLVPRGKWGGATRYHGAMVPWYHGAAVGLFYPEAATQRLTAATGGVSTRHRRAPQARGRARDTTAGHAAITCRIGARTSCCFTNHASISLPTHGRVQNHTRVRRALRQAGARNHTLNIHYKNIKHTFHAH